MPNAALARWLLIIALAALLMTPRIATVRERRPRWPDLSIELVDPKVLRVCADPRNLPFSNEKGEGFENKLAELLAAKLGKTLSLYLFSASDRLRAR